VAGAGAGVIGLCVTSRAGAPSARVLCCVHVPSAHVLCCAHVPSAHVLCCAHVPSAHVLCCAWAPCESPHAASRMPPMRADWRIWAPDDAHAEGHPRHHISSGVQASRCTGQPGSQGGSGAGDRWLCALCRVSQAQCAILRQSAADSAHPLLPSCRPYAVLPKPSTGTLCHTSMHVRRSLFVWHGPLLPSFHSCHTLQVLCCIRALTMSGNNFHDTGCKLSLLLVSAWTGQVAPSQAAAHGWQKHALHQCEAHHGLPISSPLQAPPRARGVPHQWKASCAASQSA
jgi:hypothetical protein